MTRIYPDIRISGYPDIITSLKSQNVVGSYKVTHPVYMDFVGNNYMGIGILVDSNIGIDIVNNFVLNKLFV